MAGKYVVNVGRQDITSELVLAFIQTKQHQKDGKKTAKEDARDVEKSDTTFAPVVGKELTNLESGMECFNPF